MLWIKHVKMVWNKENRKQKISMSVRRISQGWHYLAAVTNAKEI